MFLVFDQLLDALAKEAKEAPGWVLVFIASALLPLPYIVPGYQSIAEFLGEAANQEHGTVASLIAVTLFFIGDGLDTLVFPRDSVGDRAKKLLHSGLLIFASWGLFLLVLHRWLAATVCWTVWTVGLRIHANESKSAKKAGWNWLHWQLASRLTAAQTAVKSRLGIDSGIYAVSRALARAARKYSGWIMIQNESAKFFRTAVIPSLAWAAWFAAGAQWGRLALAIAAGFVTLFLYSWLKTRHMCVLYETTASLPWERLKSKNLSECVRVFLWEHEDKYALVASVPLPRTRQYRSNLPAAWSTPDDVTDLL
jgi:hypothetical protein